MSVDLKPYLYTKGTDAALDADFAATTAYCKVRPGQTSLFWKSGLRRYRIAFTEVKNIFRRVESMHIRACGGGCPYSSEWLVLVLHDDTELPIHIGDNERKKAETLLQALKNKHPEIPYGKE